MYLYMKPLTSHEREILRLWGVIRDLLDRRAHMTEREEAIFGLVYQEFAKTRTPKDVIAAYDGEGQGHQERLRATTVTLAAKAIRLLYDLENR